MANQANRDSKTQTIYAAAKKIVEAERTQHRLKTDKLRALRLAKEAESEASTPTPKPARS